MTTIQYLSLSKAQRFGVKFLQFFKNIGRGFVAFFKRLPHKFMMWGHKLSRPFHVLYDAAARGTWFTRANFLVFGFSQLFHREIIRGVLYLLYEVVFLWFFFSVGIPYLEKFTTLGTFSTTNIGPDGVAIAGGDSSMYIMLYSLVTIFFLIIFVVLWYFSIRDAKSLQDNIAVGHLSKNTQVLKDLTDKSYHVLMLAIPLVGLTAFTIIPIVFMIIVGFTNYTGTPHADLFDWVAFDNYASFFGSISGGGQMANIFLKVLAWTLLWALIATLTNYFLGMVIALLINRKGIKLKKLWRTILITTIAVPQFVSLLLINQMLAKNGILTRLFADWGWVANNTSPFESNVLLSRVIIIIVNMWVGVPYTMLICSGLLMNIPEDLYESARIDGASAWKMYMKITLPYMLFITMPYLISQFVGNINNFNIIYLLSQGEPKFAGSESLGNVGQTDLLITWIYKMSMGESSQKYAMACVLGLIVFVIIAFLSLLFYGRSSSVKNEGDFQ